MTFGSTLSLDLIFCRQASILSIKELPQCLSLHMFQTHMLDPDMHICIYNFEIHMFLKRY